MLKKLSLLFIFGLGSTQLSYATDIDAYVAHPPGETQSGDQPVKKKGFLSRAKKKMGGASKSKSTSDLTKANRDPQPTSGRRNSMDGAEAPVVPYGKAGRDSSEMLGADPKIAEQVRLRRHAELKKKQDEEARAHKETGKLPSHMENSFLQ